VFESLSHRPKAVFASGGAVLAMCLIFLLGSPPGAQASESNYCYNQSLPGSGQCVGAYRVLNALYGQGAKHSVCVWASQYASGAGFVGSIQCSPGGGQGVYNSSMALNPPVGFYPVIKANSASADTVWGVAYKP
jgi:hypothetical protein